MFADAGFDAYHFEWQLDAKEAVKRVSDRISLVGNIDNANVLFMGTPGDVYEQARYAIASGVKAILGSPDSEAAAVIGLSLALFVAKGNYEATNKAGLEILKKTAGDQGLMLVMHLSKALRDLADQGAVQRVLTSLRSR